MPWAMERLLLGRVQRFAMSITMQANVHRLSMQHPADLAGLAALFDSGALAPADVAAVIGKTEGNGGVNDFTRGYFAFALATLLSERLGTSRSEILERIPCVLSGGTEGVLSPHYLVLERRHRSVRAALDSPPSASKRLAIGVAFTEPMAPEAIGRQAHVDAIAGAVQAAMRDAGIDDVNDIHFVQVKTPCVTVARAAAAAARGASVVSTDANRAMAYARAAGAFGVAAALREADRHALSDAAMLTDVALYSSRASISSGVEVDRNEVIVLGNSARWTGDLAIAHRPMRDALDLPAVIATLADLGIAAAPQVADAHRIRGVLVKCEPDRRGAVRGHRHTMLDDTDINAQRHIRGAVGGLVAGVMGDGRIFVSGGAEHQGPDGGGLIAVIAEI
jgi:cyanuric acid amidohydrolase